MKYPDFAKAFVELVDFYRLDKDCPVKTGISAKTLGRWKLGNTLPHRGSWHRFFLMMLKNVSEPHQSACREYLQRLNQIIEQHHSQEFEPHELGTAQCALVLAEAIRRANAPTVLMGSVGEADFAQSFITRIFEEREGSRVAIPAISHLMLKRLSNQVIENQITKQALEPEFGQNLHVNLQLIKKTLERYNVKLSVLDWHSFPPPFHGWIFGEHVLLNRWAQTAAGTFHVKTTVKHHTKASSRTIWAESVRAFEI